MRKPSSSVPWWWLLASLWYFCWCCCWFLVPISAAKSSNSDPYGKICSGTQKFNDAIVIILNPSTNNAVPILVRGKVKYRGITMLETFQSNYRKYHEADILIWKYKRISNEIKSATNSMVSKKPANIRWCELNQLPSIMSRTNMSGSWFPQIQYNQKIQSWYILSQLGYKYMMYIDPYTEFISTIDYNIFQRLRDRKLTYIYRSNAQKCALDNEGYRNWLQGFADRTIPHHAVAPQPQQHLLAEPPHCPYPHFFVTETNAWMSKPMEALLQELQLPAMQSFLQEFGESIVHTSMLYLFASRKNQVRQVVDWTYRHTFRLPDRPKMIESFMESGTADTIYQKRFTAYFNEMQAYHKQEKQDMPITCYHRVGTCDNVLVPCSTFITSMKPIVDYRGPVGCHNQSDLVGQSFSDANLMLPSNTKLNNLHKKKFVVMGMSRDIDIPSFTKSIANLKSIAPKLRVFIGISESKYEGKFDRSQGNLVEFVKIPNYYPNFDNRTSQYSIFRNLVYEYAKKKVPMDKVDYIIISDADMLYPIEVDQWKTCFAFNQSWNVMTANGMLDRANIYYDVFAYRDLNAPYTRYMSEISPNFHKSYGKTWEWVPQMSSFTSFTQAKAAFGGIAIYKGAAWREAVGNNPPFEVKIPIDVCEHIPLQEKFNSSTLINPHLKYVHESNFVLPFDTYKIVLPRNGGFFSTFNFLMAALALPTRVYPLWNKAEMTERLAKVFKDNKLHFTYVQDEDNGFLNYFEPIEYFPGDKTMISPHFRKIHPQDYFVVQDNFLAPLLFPEQRPYWMPSFAVFRQYLHSIYKRFIRPKPRLLNLVEDLLPNSFQYKIGVHLRNPIHFIESGAIYFRQYYEVIDQIIEKQPNAILFVASDTQFALNEMISRYGAHRVKYHANFTRTSLDQLLQTFYPLGSGKGKFDVLGQLHLKDGSVTSDELHTSAATTTSTNHTSLGDEVIADVLSLTACDEYVGISSNIALASSYINPNMKMHLIQGLDNPREYDLIPVGY